MPSYKILVSYPSLGVRSRVVPADTVFEAIFTAGVQSNVMEQIQDVYVWSGEIQEWKKVAFGVDPAVVDHDSDADDTQLLHNARQDIEVLKAAVNKLQRHTHATLQQQVREIEGRLSSLDTDIQSRVDEEVSDRFGDLADKIREV